MTKTLRLSMLSLLLMLCSTMGAQTVTFTAGTDMGTTTADAPGADQITKDGVTIAISNGAMAEAQYRVYKGNTFTVSSTVGNITKIEVTCTANGTTKQGPGCLENPTTGSYTFEASGKNGTWTGDAAEVQFSTPNNQCRMTKVVVTIGEGGGEEPKPFDGETVANIAAFKALADGTEAKLTLTNAEVLYAGTNDTYVRDASGAIDFYRAGLSLTAGNVLNGSVIGKYTLYNTTPEFVSTENTNASDIQQTAGNVQPKAITPADAANYICDLVKISGATIVERTEGEFTNTYAVVGSQEVMVFDKFKVVAGKAEEGKTYDLVGIIVPFKETVELCPTEDYTGGTTPEPQPDEVKEVSVAEFNAADESTTVWYKLKGEVKNLKDGDQYGNFDLEDATGSVYVYGLLSEKGGEKKQFQALAQEKGIKNGCIITIIGNRGSYKDQIEVLNAYFVSVDQAAPAELTIQGDEEFEGSTTVTIVPSDVDHDVYYTLDGTDPKTSSTNARYMEPFTINETCTVRAWEEDADLYAEKTFTKKATQQVENIAAFKALDDKSVAELKLSNAKVVYSWTSTNGNTSSYVRDASGAIVFYNTGIELKQNQDVNGSLLLQYSIYNNLPEAVKTDGTNADKLTITDGAEAEAKAITVAQAADNLCDLVELQGVQIAEEGGKYYAVDGDDKVQIYNGFHLDAFNDLSAFVTTEPTNVKGIMVVYRTTYEIYPIEDGIVSGITNVNAAAQQADGRIYNLAGQRVSENYKGIVIVGGKKYLVK